MTPKIKLGKMILFSAVVLLIMVVFSGWVGTQLPDDTRIPTHWNARGEVDGYSSKAMGLFMTPGVMAGLCVLMALLPFITPRKENLWKSIKVYKICWVGVLLFMLVIHSVALLAALGVPVPMSIVVYVGIGALFIVIGNWLGKVRSNFIMGVRTPWTLSSELSWNKTHRLAGKLFVGVGLAMLVSGLFFSTHPAAAKVMITGVILLVLVPVTYSWWVWKNDPDRQS